MLFFRAVKTYDDFQMKLNFEHWRNDLGAVSSDASFVAWKNSTKYEIDASRRRTQYREVNQSSEPEVILPQHREMDQGESCNKANHSGNITLEKEISKSQPVKKRQNNADPLGADSELNLKKRHRRAETNPKQHTVIDEPVIIESEIIILEDENSKTDENGIVVATSVSNSIIEIDDDEPTLVNKTSYLGNNDDKAILQII